MKENEWIDPRKELPKLDQLVYVGLRVPVKYIVVEKAKFSINNDGFIGFLNSKELIYDIDLISGWRPISEKRPDFSRLKKDDVVALKLSNERYSEKIGYIHSIGCNQICITSYKDNYNGNIHYEFENVSKITRINIEDKTFEEI